MTTNDSNGVSRRHLLALGAAGAALPILGHAEDYPSRPIRLVLTSAAGGGVDITARIVATRMAEDLKTSIAVDPKPGASGLIAADMVAKATPDGYTLLFSSGSSLTIVPQIVAKSPFHPLNDLIPINWIGGSPLVISMNPASGIKSLADLIAAARSRPLKMASAGLGTLTHVCIELLSAHTGGKIVHVPYKGGGPALIDALAGHVDGMLSDVPPVLQHVNEGRLVAAAVTGEQRLPLLPNVAAVAEVIPGFSAVAWQGAFAPARTPTAVIDKLSAAMVRAVASESVSSQLRKVGLVPASFPNPDAFRRFFVAEHERLGKFVRERNITMSQ